MQQLLLDIAPYRRAPTLEHFISGHNHEALSAIRQLIHNQHSEPVLYLWGPASSGKTHLLQAASNSAQTLGTSSCYCPAEQVNADAFSHHEFVCIDNVESLSAEQQIMLFSAINRAREGHGRLLCAGHTPPAQSKLRADLSSRLGWHLVYQLVPADETSTRDALQQRAWTLGFSLDTPLIDYLMCHWQRDLAALLTVIEQLDRLSREQRCSVTLPLLRKTLATLCHTPIDPNIEQQTTQIAK